MAFSAQYRIGVIGTKGKDRLYLTTDETGKGVELVGREDALHWERKIAGIIARSLNVEFKRLGRTEQFQIEKAQ